MKTFNILVLLMFSLLIMAGCGGDDQPEANASTVPEVHTIKVSTIKVVPTPMNDILVLPGETEARHDVTLSAERGGNVEWVGPEEGEEIEEGGLIAKIDMSKAEADLSKAQAAYRLADKQAARRVELLDQNVVSKEEMDKADNDRTSAASGLRQAQVSYDQGMIRSPIKGIVNDLEMDPGEYVNAGQSIANVVDISEIRIHVDVPEMDVRHLAKGQFAKVTIDAYPGEQWDGIIDFVSFKADSATKTFKTRVVVDNSDKRIRPGMLARVALQRQSIEEAIVAPLFAIQDKGGERILFVEENGVARARSVVLGVIDGDKIQIMKGLNAGDNLIVTGQNEVEDGVPVTTGTSEAAQQ